MHGGTNNSVLKFVESIEDLTEFSQSSALKSGIVLVVDDVQEFNKKFIESELASRLARFGFITFTFTGTNAELAHDALDCVLEELGTFDITTTWHDDETPEEIAIFVFTSYKSNCLDQVVAVVDPLSTLGGELKKIFSEASRAMIILTLTELIVVLDRYLSDKGAFEEVRSFVFQYYEAEEETELDESLKQLLPVLAPYMEYEEAYGDSDRERRLRRLRLVLEDEAAIAERALFALEFPRVQDLTKRLKQGEIDRETYKSQLKKLSPAVFDERRIALWAAAHADEKDVNTAKMT